VISRDAGLGEFDDQCVHKSNQWPTSLPRWSKTRNPSGGLSECLRRISLSLKGQAANIVSALCTPNCSVSTGWNSFPRITHWTMNIGRPRIPTAPTSYKLNRKSRGWLRGVRFVHRPRHHVGRSRLVSGGGSYLAAHWAWIDRLLLHHTA